MDWVKVGELGAVVIAMLCILVLVEVIRRRYREPDQVERMERDLAHVIECPNKVKELPAVLNALGDRLSDLVDLAREQNKTIFHSAEGVDTLVKQHAPVGGVEQWKVGSDTLKVFRDNQKSHHELLEEIKIIVTQHSRILSIIERRDNL